MSSDFVRIRELPQTERPRERLQRLGADALKDQELLAILIRTGTQKASALDLATQLIQHFGTLEGLAKSSLDELRQISGIGLAKATELHAAFTLARRLTTTPHDFTAPISQPEMVVNLLREEMRMYEVEVFMALLLNTKNRVMKKVKISTGILNASLVHPREVFKPAIQAGSASIILVHNHPSGDPTPSQEDIRVTRELVEAGHLLKIDVLDHIIIGKKDSRNSPEYVSLKAQGYL